MLRPACTPPPPRARRALAPAALLAVLGAGCATYTERTQEAFDDFRSGHLDLAVDAYRDRDLTGSRFLSGAEAGTAALTAGRFDEAQELLTDAARAVEDVERRALVGPEELAETLGSWALNDTMRAYEGEGFERVYLHVLLGLTYLAQGLVDDVYVEARLSNRLLETEEELYDAEYRAGGLGHLLSAIAYELLDEPGEAYIDYRRMAEKGVADELVGPALVRLARDLGRGDDLDDWRERYGDAPTPDPDAATIVVLGGVGLGPYKVEHRAHIPTGDGLVNLAVPEYVDRPQPVHRLRLHLPDASATADTVVVEDVSRIARENLEDRILWTAARSAARGLLKRELTKVLEDEYDGWGRLAGEVFSLATERADLRHWSTLPDTWQAARAFVPPGRHELLLEAVGGETVLLGTFALEPGETMFVVARSLGPTLFAHPVGGLRVQDPATPTAAGTWTDPIP